MEWVSAKYRALGTTLICTSFPLGEMLLGVIASQVHDFRMLLRVLYVPGLLVFFYFWLVPESVRWMLITGRVDRAIKILKRIARINNKTLSDKSIELLHLQYSIESKATPVESGEVNDNLSLYQQIRLVAGSKKLGLRMLICYYLWMTCCFCYYGYHTKLMH